MVHNSVLEVQQRLLTAAPDGGTGSIRKKLLWPHLLQWHVDKSKAPRDVAHGVTQWLLSVKELNEVGGDSLSAPA